MSFRCSEFGDVADVALEDEQVRAVRASQPQEIDVPVFDSAGELLTGNEPQAHVGRLFDQTSQILRFFKSLRRRLGLGRDCDLPS